jgi:hypothetical protein
LEKFPQLFAFKEGILDTQISAFGDWPTVSVQFLRLNVALIAVCNFSLINQLQGKSQKLISLFKVSFLQSW